MADGIHPDAAEGFAAVAGVYERSRPSYPDAAIAHLQRRFDLGPGQRVLDLAAGTGKLTRVLVPLGVHVTAVEPLVEMRAELRRVLPEITVLDGTAEAIPLPGRAVDVATVGQAFHWFDPVAALAEIARVVRPGGGLAMLWNVRRRDEGWLADLDHIVRWGEFARGRYDERDWPSIVAASGAFSPLEHAAFPYEQHLTHEGVVERVASVSYIAAMTADERAPILDRVRELVAPIPEPVVVPYRTEVWTCTRLA